MCAEEGGKKRKMRHTARKMMCTKRDASAKTMGTTQNPKLHTSLNPILDNSLTIPLVFLTEHTKVNLNVLLRQLGVKELKAAYTSSVRPHTLIA